MIKKYIQNIIEKIKNDPNLLLPGLIVLVGLLSGFAAVIFKYSIHWFENFLYFNHSFHFETNCHFIIIPAACSLFAGIFLTYIFPQSKGSGIPQLKTALYYRYGIFPAKEIFGKFAVCVLCIGGGLAVGAEGPTIFICGIIGSWIGQIFSLKKANIKNLVICGSAGGLAAAFNTPITGIMFVLEELLGNFSTHIIGTTIISCVLASTLQRLMLGNHPSFIVAKYQLVQPLELIFYLGLGICCGILSWLFIKLLIFSTNKISKFKIIPKMFIPAAGGLVIGIAAFYLPAQITGFNYTPELNKKSDGNILETLKSNIKTGLTNTNIYASDDSELLNNSIAQSNKIKETPENQIIQKPVGPATALYRQIEDVMANNITGRTLIYLLIFKFVAVILCHSAGIPGGILMPAIFIGSMIGGSVGYVINLFYPAVTGDMGAYALVGMGAFFAGVMKSPITSILLVFELTHNYEIILPLMLANMASFTVSRYLFKSSIYDAILNNQGIYLPTESVDLKSSIVKEAMTSPVKVMNGNITVSDAMPLFTFYQFYSYPVVDDKGKMLGMLKKYMLKRDIINKNPDMKICDLIKNKSVPMLYQNDSIDTAIKFLGSYETSVLPVLNSKEENKVIGIITHTDIIKFYAKETTAKNKNKLVRTIDEILQVKK
ncbi:chloride channel protein [Candidatus Dependentiae bacterium]|nr:chloride channel protein [Candidatus Dependentiae bacterium]